MEWVPLLMLVALPIVTSRWLEGWALMWALAAAIFVGFKLATWYRAIAGGVKTSPLLSAAYLFVWPGMDAGQFLQPSSSVRRPPPRLWAVAAGKTALGVALVWGLARFPHNELDRKSVV